MIYKHLLLLTATFTLALTQEYRTETNDHFGQWDQHDDLGTDNGKTEHRPSVKKDLNDQADHSDQLKEDHLKQNPDLDSRNFSTDPITNILLNASWILVKEMQIMVKRMQEPIKQVVQTVQQVVNHPSEILFKLMEPRFSCNYTQVALNTDGTVEEDPCEKLVNYCTINKWTAVCVKEGICTCIQKFTK